MTVGGRGRGSRGRAGEARRWLAPLVALALLGVLLVAMSDRLVRGMVYPAPLLRVPSPPPAPFEEVVLDSRLGHRIVGWSFRPPVDDGEGPAVGFFHGNGENLETMRLSGLLDELTGLGVSFLVVDYPGYGRSEGKPSEEANAAAAEAALDWLEEAFPGRPLVLAGWSLGAAVAIQATARQPERVAGLIALSPWTSIVDVAARFYPRFLVRLALDDTYDSLAAAGNIEAPALVVHGEADRIIPVEHGERVAEALASPTLWVPVRGAGHNDLFSHPRVWEALEGFLRDQEAPSGRGNR